MTFYVEPRNPLPSPSSHILPTRQANRSVEEQATTPTISIIFNPSLRVDDRLPDTILVSSNQVHFYVHRHRILSSSYNAFNARLHDVVSFARGTLPTLYLPDSGDVLNVVVHTMYGLSCVHFHPAFDTVAAALPALARYGVPLGPSPDPTAPTSHAGPVHELVLAHAPYHPIDTYALAARHGLDGAAVAASGHLLAFDLSLVTDALATAMGPVYLKRLFLLHQARRAALREILLRAPARAAAHPPCDGRALLREWALVTASLVWDVTPGEWFVFVGRGLGTGG